MGEAESGEGLTRVVLILLGKGKGKRVVRQGAGTDMTFE